LYKGRLGTELYKERSKGRICEKEDERERICRRKIRERIYIKKE
jgi:hypothetical protein